MTDRKKAILKRKDGSVHSRQYLPNSQYPVATIGSAIEVDGTVEEIYFKATDLIEEDAQVFQE